MKPENAKTKAGQDRRFEPPCDLSERSKLIWASVCPRRCQSPERILFLEQCLRWLDRADTARRLIGDELTTKSITTGALRANPLIAIEAEARKQFARTWAQLDLHYDSVNGACTGRADAELD